MSDEPPTNLQNLTPAEAESHYFQVNPPPASLQRYTEEARAFIDHHVAANRRVVLVTSGGTTVPLETQTVRFIDNFSAGTRGATSAEYFLQEGYAVIFLHRQFSLLPYARHYSHSTNCFLDFMDEAAGGATSADGGNNEDEDAGGPIVVRKEYQQHIRKVLRQYRYAKQHNRLLLLSFTTVTEYLYELRSLAFLMRPLGANALFYLAAAVSDFFIPHNQMVEHKIQSSNEAPAPAPAPAPSRNQKQDQDPDQKDPITPEDIYTGFNDPQPPTHPKKLIVNLDPVPKFLHRLVNGWAPDDSMIISFKLETDPALLISKSEQALQRYAHHLVIGNLLTTRKWEVVFVSRRPGDGGLEERWIRIPRPDGEDAVPQGQQLQEIRGEREEEIESVIIPEVKKMHSGMIEAARRKGEAKNT